MLEKIQTPAPASAPESLLPTDQTPIVQFLREQVLPEGAKPQLTEQAIRDISTVMRYYIVAGVEEAGREQGIFGAGQPLRDADADIRVDDVKVKRIRNVSLFDDKHRMHISSKRLYKPYPNDEMLAEVGFVPKDPRDIPFLSLVRTVAHETVHAGTSGMTKKLKRERGYDEKDKTNLYVTRNFLAANPQYALTGHLDSDVAGVEEAKARQLEEPPVRKTMRALGYEEDQIDKYIQVGMAKPQIKGKPGLNQLDHIDKTTAKAGPNKQLSPVHWRNAHRYNEGLLGYAFPGKAIEMLTDEKTTNPTEEQIGLTPETWHEQFPDKQGPEAATYIQDLQERRAQYLQEEKARRQSPEHKRARRRSIAAVAGSIAAGLALAVATNQIINDKPAPRHYDSVSQYDDPGYEYSDSDLNYDGIPDDQTPSKQPPAHS